MKSVVLLVLGLIIFFIFRNYNTQKYSNIKIDIKEKFDGDLYKHEAGLLIALMAKVAKADGKICELEAELLKHTFDDISTHFINHSEIRSSLKQIYLDEKASFDNTIEISSNLLKITRFDYKKRLQILEYLLNLAFIDNNFSKTEFMIIEDISSALKVQKIDLDNLINKFEDFYKNRSNSNKLDLETSFNILGIDITDDMDIVKKRYRYLVKKYHPDIVIAKGSSEDIIENVTKKLQEINEAYSFIKKSSLNK
jgi:DnaJ like chaperone protein